MYVVPASNFFSRLSYTIGAGFGRFSSISPKDFSEGKGWSGITNLFPQDRKYGTFGFAALQFKISKNLAYTVEWSGINLNTGISFLAKIGNVPIRFTVAAADLTDFTGSGVRWVGGFTIGFKQKTKKVDDEEEKPKSGIDMEKLEELLKINQIETLSHIDKTIQDKVAEIANAQLDSTKNVNYADNTHLNNKNNRNQTNNNQINKGNNEINENDNVDKLDNYQQLRILTAEKVTEYSFTEEKGERLQTGIYLVIYSFKNKGYAERAFRTVRSSGIDAYLAYNQTRDWYYIYAETFDIDSLQIALSKCDVYRSRGYDGAWLLFFN